VVPNNLSFTPPKLARGRCGLLAGANIDFQAWDSLAPIRSDKPGPDGAGLGFAAAGAAGVGVAAGLGVAAAGVAAGVGVVAALLL